MTNQSFALIKRHSFHAHTIEIIIGCVVFRTWSRQKEKYWPSATGPSARGIGPLRTAWMLAKRLIWARFLLEPDLTLMLSKRRDLKFMAAHYECLWDGRKRFDAVK